MGDFRHRSLWETFHIQAMAGGEEGFVLQKSAALPESCRHWQITVVCVFSPCVTKHLRNKPIILTGNVAICFSCIYSGLSGVHTNFSWPSHNHHFLGMHFKANTSLRSFYRILSLGQMFRWFLCHTSWLFQPRLQSQTTTLQNRSQCEINVLNTTISE